VGVPAVLIVFVVLLAAAPAAGAQDEIAPIVEGLRADSVYVDPEVDADVAAVRDEIAERGLDLNIAVLPEGEDPGQIAGQVYERLGEGGTLAVVSGTRIEAGPSEGARVAAREAAEANSGEAVEAVLLDFVERAEGGGDEGGFGAGGGV